MLIEHIILGVISVSLIALFTFVIIRDYRAIKEMREVREKRKKENPYAYVYDLGGLRVHHRRAEPLTEEQINNWETMLGVEITRVDD